jgi:ribose/xylose/arabinose/galactoside ABC-type transport system permease subunit
MPVMQQDDVSSAPVARGRGRFGGRAHEANLVTALSLVGASVLLVASVSLDKHDFLSHQTLLAIAFTMSISGTLAIGQSLVTISGGVLDLSVPASLIFPAFVCAQLTSAGFPPGAAVPLSILTGMAWGLLNAVIIVAGRINPIIVTLGTNFAGESVLLLLFNTASVPPRSGLATFGLGHALLLPNTWWPMVAATLIAAFVLRRTRAGAHLVAAGGNPGAARVRGISLRKVRFAVFLGSGACAGLAGVLFASETGTFAPTDGDAFLLPVVAIVILAGIALRGGRGHPAMLLISGAFLAIVPTALVFFGLNPYWQQAFQGLILVAAVSIDGQLQRRRRRQV